MSKPAGLCLTDKVKRQAVIIRENTAADGDFDSYYYPGNTVIINRLTNLFVIYIMAV